MDKEIIKEVTENINNQNQIIKYLEYQLKFKKELRDLLIKNRKECHNIYKNQLKGKQIKEVKNENRQRNFKNL